MKYYLFHIRTTFFRPGQIYWSVGVGRTRKSAAYNLRLCYGGEVEFLGGWMEMKVRPGNQPSYCLPPLHPNRRYKA